MQNCHKISYKIVKSLDNFLLKSKIDNMDYVAKSPIQMLLVNPVFLSAVSSWLSAQFIKTVIKLLSGHVHSLKELPELLLWKTGSMPSSHSALMSSLCTTVGFRSGINSDIFIVTLCFSLVVIRDALGVRRSSGIQAKMINAIGTVLNNQKLMDFTPVKEVQGHKPLEVVVGCFLGVFIGMAFSVL